jgi:hypothetical protein
MKRYLLLFTPDYIPKPDVAGVHQLAEFPGVKFHHWPYHGGFTVAEIEEGVALPPQCQSAEDVTEDDRFSSEALKGLTEEQAYHIGNDYFIGG